MEDQDRTDDMEMKNRERGKEESRKQEQETSFIDKNNQEDQERSKARRERVNEATNVTGGGNVTVDDILKDNTTEVVTDKVAKDRLEKNIYRNDLKEKTTAQKEFKIYAERKVQQERSRPRGKVPEVYEPESKLEKQRQELILGKLQTYLKGEKFKYLGRSEDGPESAKLFERLELIISEKTGKANGLKYRTVRIFNIKTQLGEEVIEPSKSVHAPEFTKQFKEQLEKAQQEYLKTPRSDMNEAAGVNLPPEAVKSVKEEVVEELKANIKQRIQQEKEKITKPVPEPRQRVQKEESTHGRPGSVTLTAQQISELEGVLTKGDDEEEITPERSEQITNDLNVQIEHLNRLIEEEDNPIAKQTYKNFIKIAEKQIDSIKLRANEKPVTEEVKELVKEKTKTNILTKFEQFKEWAKTLGKFGVYATALGGVITSIVVNAKLLLKKTKDGFDKFKEMLKKFADKAGPVVKVILQAAGAILSIMAKGAEFLSKYIWLLFVALAFVVYSEFKSYRAYRRNQSNP